VRIQAHAKPAEHPIRRTRPSVAVAPKSGDSPIITIGTIPPGQNEDRTLRKGIVPAWIDRTLSASTPRGSDTATVPPSGSI
jgi:hypothetical protein